MIFDTLYILIFMYMYISMYTYIQFLYDYFLYITSNQM